MEKELTMTLVCCTLTNEFTLISGDIHVTNEKGTRGLTEKFSSTMTS
jgi:hypothetical protein